MAFICQQHMRTGAVERMLAVRIRPKAQQVRDFFLGIDAAKRRMKDQWLHADVCVRMQAALAKHIFEFGKRYVLVDQPGLLLARTEAGLATHE